MMEANPDPPPSVASSSEPRQTRKRLLAPVHDPAEDLVAHIKKCRVSSTPGELRLKKDLSEGDLLCQQGIARFDRTAGSPLECQLTFLCPIGSMGGVQGQQAGGAGGPEGGLRRVPTTFSVVVPKFYPHDPPLLYAERCFRLTCPFVRDDGLLQLPFLSPGVWSSISTMSYVAQTLLEGLKKFAEGHPQPWGPPPVNLQTGRRGDPYPQRTDKATLDCPGDRGEVSGDTGGSRSVGAMIATGGAVLVCDEALLVEESCREVEQAGAGSTAKVSSDGTSESSSSRSSEECGIVAGRRPHQEMQHSGDSCCVGVGEFPVGMDVADSL